MERLTKLINRYEEHLKFLEENWEVNTRHMEMGELREYKEYCLEQECVCNYLKELKSYRDAEEQGLLLRLPCKLGDTVYNTRWWDCERESVKVDGKTYFREVRKPKISKEKFSLFDYKDFGKTVFLTREEAEQALAEMEK